MDSFIIGDHMLMADSLVVENHRQYCRDATNLDFANLEGVWVPHEQFNKYMNALREKVGAVGPRIIGRQVAGVIEKVFGSMTKAGNVQKAFMMIPEMYKENNTGSECGEYNVEKLDPNFIRVVTTSPLDEGFHIGVGEGVIRFFVGVVTKTEAVETRAIDGRSVFEYTFMGGAGRKLG
jgi:hypothetical protein